MGVAGPVAFWQALGLTVVLAVIPLLDPVEPQSDARGVPDDPWPQELLTADEPAVMSSTTDVELQVPSRAPRFIGFHEPSYDHALAQEPREELEHTVMASRGRPTPATGAVDIAVAHQAEILAPVSGEISNVEEYSLYERTGDYKIEIVPAQNTDVEVILLHLEGPRVTEGNTVEAGHTVLADGARQLPFHSQVDSYAADAHGYEDQEYGADPYPHVHLEVAPVDRPER